MTSTPSLSERLAAIVGPDHVQVGADALAPYLTDWRGRYTGSAQCVVRPGNAAEVAAVVQACHAAGVPMVPQGGNTSLCGAATPDAGGQAVVISLARLNRVRAVDPQNNTLTAEAGCTLAAIQEAARQAGRLFPLSLASEGSCQLGGNLSTNAGGVQVLRYGNTRELTLGLEAVLPDGRLWEGLRGLRKDNTGYDLKQLFIGAEGTLGIITAAVVKLFPLPHHQVTAWLAVASPEQAVAVLSRAQGAFDARLTAFELVSEVSLGLVLRHVPGSRRPLAEAPWYILCEFSGGEYDDDLSSRVERWLGDLLATQYVLDAVVAQSESQAAALWQLRENISEAQKREGLSIKHDVSVPVSRIPQFLAAADKALNEHFPGVRTVVFGHLGDGNLHFNLSRADDQENAAFIAQQPAANRRVHDLVHAFGGSISAEHGVGQLKREEILRYKGEVEMTLMHAIKSTLDPRNLMNPGKVL